MICCIQLVLHHDNGTLDIVTARLTPVGALTMYINAIKSLVGIFAIVVNGEKTKTYKVSVVHRVFTDLNGKRKTETKQHNNSNSTIVPCELHCSLLPVTCQNYFLLSWTILPNNSG